MKILKLSQIQSQAQNTNENENEDNFKSKLEEAYYRGYDRRIEYKEGNWCVINPDVRKTPTGRAFLTGWNDSAWGKPRQLPSNILDIVSSDEWIEIA